MKRLSVIGLVITAILVTVAIMWFLVGTSHLEQGGGAYATSPDGRWLAEISDAHSQVHNRSFAVIRLWDLNKYPSVHVGVAFNNRKVPTVQLEFPQKFDARDENCKVSWATNSTEFFVDINQLRRFRYDIASDAFSLSTAPAQR